MAPASITPRVCAVMGTAPPKTGIAPGIPSTARIAAKTAILVMSRMSVPTRLAMVKSSYSSCVRRHECPSGAVMNGVHLNGVQVTDTLPTP